jgi:lysine biosynthesis protein LysW
VDVTCGKCGAGLRLNPNLQGTTVSCPRCGAAVQVPRVTPRRREEAPRGPRRFGASYTMWLLGAQTALAALGVSCVVGAFYHPAGLPQWSYLRESPYVLFGAGGAFFLAVWAAYHLPVLTTLLVSLLVLGACALRYLNAGTVDLSRTLALAVAMLALWLALSHRRASAAR